MNQEFSTEHTFSRQQVRDTVSTVAKDNATVRSLLSVSSGHRSSAERQFRAIQVATAVCVFCIMSAEFQSATIPSSSLLTWLIVSTANIIFRHLLSVPLFREPPEQVARSIILRCVPLLIVIMACGYWIWTIHLFVSSELSLSTLFLILGLLSISISMVGMWVTTPAPATFYLALVWGSFFLIGHDRGLLNLGMVVSLFVSLSVILGLFTFTTVRQVRGPLGLIDQKDLQVAELTDSKAVAETALEARSAFFTTASHDFKQRLHAMKLMVHSTTMSLHPGDRSRSALQRLSSCVMELEGYARDVLDFARLESVHIEPRYELTPMHCIFQKVNLHFEDMAVSRNVDLKFRFAGQQLRTDPGMLERIVENLVCNAIKFTKRSVLVAARSCRDGGVRLEVWDQGEGLQPELQERIFEAFHQEDRTYAGAQAGAGLGLPVVKRFAQALGYEVDLRSNPGRGSVFRVRIPPDAVLSHD